MVTHAGKGWTVNPMLRAEWMVINRRWSGRAIVVVSLAIGVLAAALMLMIQRMGGEGGLTFNGTPVDQIVTVSTFDASTWALRIRQFFVLPVLLLFATGGALASERADQTLRERLVQPVTRDRILGTKLVALVGVSLVSLACTLITSLVCGFLLFDVQGGASALLLGYLLSALTDLGVIALGLALSVMVRSAGAVVIMGLMFLALDWGARMGLGLLAMLGLEGASQAVVFLFGTGLGVWSATLENGSVVAFFNLAIWTLLLLGIARMGLQRIDVP